MSLISPDMSGIVDGSAAAATAWTTPMQTIIDVINGGLDSDNISDNSISNSKIQAVAWSTWSPSYGGFSSAPVPAFARYIQIGKLVFCQLSYNTHGTSNANTFTVTLPVACKYGGAIPLGRAVDNTTTQSAIPIGVTGDNSTTMTIYKTAAAASTDWTASGTKDVDWGTIIYEAV